MVYAYDYLSCLVERAMATNVGVCLCTTPTVCHLITHTIKWLLGMTLTRQLCFIKVLMLDDGAVIKFVNHLIF